MGNAFTHYWSGSTVDLLADEEGEPLINLGSNSFRKRGVGVGDTIYVVNVREGVLHVLGRLQVGQICDPAEARRHLAALYGEEGEPWDAADQLIAAPGSATPLTGERPVPADVVRELRFETNDGPVGLVFVAPGLLDRQTMRGVRRLTPSSAALLDALIDGA
jgi:hypothetical protein